MSKARNPDALNSGQRRRFHSTNRTGPWTHGGVRGWKGDIAYYVVITSWADEGIRQAGGTVPRAEQGQELAVRLGGHRDVLHWTMGEYDMVAIYDMPSDEAFASLIIKIGEAGQLRTSSLKGITVNETGTILESIV